MFHPAACRPEAVPAARIRIAKIRPDQRLLQSKRKRFFFEKKKQKTSVNCGH
jgi:hypothetical protein